MTCVKVLESGDLAFVSAVTGHGFSLVSSLMYTQRVHSSYIGVLKRYKTYF